MPLTLTSCIEFELKMDFGRRSLIVTVHSCQNLAVPGANPVRAKARRDIAVGRRRTRESTSVTAILVPALTITARGA
jgi:hypothetical protein